MIFSDLKNKTFNKITILEFVEMSKHGKAIWRCQCSCGNYKNMIGANVANGRTKSCGSCVKSPNLIGKRFGKLLVMDKLDVRTKWGRSKLYWNCICDCGNEHEVHTGYLTSGRVKSCGCYLTAEEAAYRELYGKYKHGSNKRNLDFKLTLEEFKELITQNCFYCNRGLSNKQKSQKKSGVTILYNGIDRMNNNIGYIKENCIPCCFRCNRAKGKLSKEDFLKLVNNIYNHQQGKNV